MESQLIELHLAQLLTTWSKSKFNKYSDSDKQSYHNKLGELIHKLTSEDFASTLEPQKKERKAIIDFIFKSLEFLNNSTQALFPYEIIECLNVALKDWTNEKDFIIVTSLNNNLLSYSFDPSLAFDDNIFIIIEKVYDIKFGKRLIQINLPQSLANDYLANVVLYHELGHFIDLKYQISRSLAYDIINNYQSYYIERKDQIKSLFDFIDNISICKSDKLYVMENHIAEYFADIFAAQYIGSCSNYYLDYITNSSNNPSITHPSTTNRIKIVNDFLLDGQHYMSVLLKEATLKSTPDKQLKVRYNMLANDDFLSLLPIDIEEESELSSLFIVGWEVWMNKSKNLETCNNMQFTLKHSRVYQILNNLIEKSISNFIIKKSWEEAKKHVPN